MQTATNTTTIYAHTPTEGLHHHHHHFDGQGRPPSSTSGSAIDAHGLRSIAHGHSANVTFATSVVGALEAASRDSVGTAVNYVSSLSALEAFLESRVADPGTLTALLRTTPNAVDVRWSSSRGTDANVLNPGSIAAAATTTLVFAVRVVVGYGVELVQPTPLELVIQLTPSDDDDDDGGAAPASGLEAAVRARFEEAGAVSPSSFACHTIERLGTLVLGMAFDAGAAWASVEVRKPTIAELCGVTLEYASFRIWGRADDPVLASGLDAAAWVVPVHGVAPADLGGYDDDWQQAEARLRGPPPPKLSPKLFAVNFAVLQRHNAAERAYAVSRCAAHINALPSTNNEAEAAPLRVLDVGTGDGQVLSDILRGVDAECRVTALEPNADLARAAGERGVAVLGEAFSPTWSPDPAAGPVVAGEKPFDVALFVQSLYGHGDDTRALLRRALELADRVIVVHRAGGVLTDVLNGRDRFDGVFIEAAHTDLSLRTSDVLFDEQLHACLSAMTGRDVDDDASATWARRKLGEPASTAVAPICGHLPLPTSVVVLRASRGGGGISRGGGGGGGAEQPVPAGTGDAGAATAASSLPADPVLARLRSGLGTVQHEIVRGEEELRAALKFRGHKAHALPPDPMHTLHVELRYVLTNPSTVDELSTCLRAASDNAVPVSIVGGGHSGHGVPTSAQHPNCANRSARHLFADAVMVVSMAGMRSVSAVEDAERRRLITVGGGAQQGDVATVLDARGWCAPLGSRPSVGIGLVLGGGIGHFPVLLRGQCRDDEHDGVAPPSPRFASDAVVAATVVRPDGTIQRLGDGCDDAEAWWALRGAGSVLGCVVELTIECAEFPRNAACVTRRFVAADGGDDIDDDRIVGEALADAGTDLYLMPRGRVVAQTFTTTAAATQKRAEPISEDVLVEKLPTNHAVFGAEYHREMDKAARDFKRSFFFTVATHSNGESGDFLRGVLRDAPSAKCYIHIVRLPPPPPPPKSATESASAAAVGSTLLGHLDSATHCAVVTGRWDDPKDEHQVVDWVYRTVRDAVRGNLRNAYPYAVDLGPSPADAELALDAFPAVALARIRNVHESHDPQHVLRNCFPAFAPSFCCSDNRSGGGKGPVVCIVGPHGAGKTTAARLLLEELAADSVTGAGPAAAAACAVSVSEAFKRRFARARPDIDEEMLLAEDDFASPRPPAVVVEASRAYKESLRAELSEAHAAEQAAAACAFDYELGSIARALADGSQHLNTDAVTILVGPRDADIADKLRALNRNFCIVRVDASGDDCGTPTPPTVAGDVVLRNDIVQLKDASSFAALRAALRTAVLPIVRTTCARRQGQQPPARPHTVDGVRRRTRLDGQTGMLHVRGALLDMALQNTLARWAVDAIRRRVSVDPAASTTTRRRRRIVLVGAETTGVPFAIAVAHQLRGSAVGDQPSLVVWSKAAAAALPAPHVTATYGGSNVTKANTALTLVGDLSIIAAGAAADDDEEPPFVVFLDDTIASGATMDATHRALVNSPSFGNRGYDLALFAFGLPLLLLAPPPRTVPTDSAARARPPCETFASYALLR